MMSEDISQKIDEMKDKKDRVEKHNAYFLAIIEELQEEKEVLKKKVEAWQEMQRDITRTSKQRRNKTAQLLEVEELKKDISFLKRQQCEGRDRVGFIQDRLYCSKRLNNHFNLVIDKLQEEINEFHKRHHFLKERLKGKRPNLWRRFCWFFCPRKETDDMNHLITKMNLIKAGAAELQDKLQYVSDRYNTEVAHANSLNEEIKQLEGKLNGLKEWLLKDKVPFSERVKNHDDDNILKKEKSEVIKKLKDLKRTLAETQSSGEFYKGLMTTFQKEEKENIKTIKHIEDMLLKTR